MFEFWIELSHLIICYIGVYCGISIGIWLMVQAIDEVNRIRRKPVVEDISIDWDYKELFDDLVKRYKGLEDKCNDIANSTGIILKENNDLWSKNGELETENRKLQVTNGELETEIAHLKYNEGYLCNECEKLERQDNEIAKQNNSIKYLRSECERFQRQSIDFKEEKEAYRNKLLKIQSVIDLNPTTSNYGYNRIKEILVEEE